ncbi:hypothetical protein MZH83_16630, partial [Escherichia coli]|nr:hypothetical protein [Escherichia coli]
MKAFNKLFSLVVASVLVFSLAVMTPTY